MATPKEKAEAVMASMTDRQIVEAAATIDALESHQDQPRRDAERLTYAWLMDELERRHPELDAPLAEIFHDESYAGTYLEAVLLAAGRIGLVL